MKLKQIFISDTGGPRDMAYMAHYGEYDFELTPIGYGEYPETAIADLIDNYDLEFDDA